MNIFQVNIRNTLRSTEEKIYRYALLILILIGLIFRMRIFLTGRSLWLDEAMLALNIIQRSDFMLDYIDRTGKRVREYRVPETSVYLYLYDMR